jgi:hypothetical protein
MHNWLPSYPANARQSISLARPPGKNLYMLRGVLLESSQFWLGEHKEWRIVMQQSHLLTAFVAALVLTLSCLSPISSEAKQGRTYKVHGTVIAVTLGQTPPLIVVKTPLGPQNHMTVGATVTSRTKIYRGKKRVGLDTVKEGETVWLTYTKSARGLLAEVIRVGL